MSSMSLPLSRLRRIFGFLRSRKVRVALATVAAAVLAEYGFKASEEVIFTLLGLGTALILGIAHEDAGRKSAHFVPRTTSRTDPGNVERGVRSAE